MELQMFLKFLSGQLLEIMRCCVAPLYSFFFMLLFFATKAQRHEDEELRRLKEVVERSFKSTREWHNDVESRKEDGDPKMIYWQRSTDYRQRTTANRQLKTLTTHNFNLPRCPATINY